MLQNLTPILCNAASDEEFHHDLDVDAVFDINVSGHRLGENIMRNSLFIH